MDKTFNKKRKDLWGPIKSREIVELYNSGESCTKISKRFNVTANTISSILKANNVVVTNRQNEISYTDDEIIEDYCVKKLSLAQISKKRKTSTDLVSKKLKANGINVQNFHNAAKFDETIFNVIDTEEKAYWLGFIYADGYISSSDFSFELSLAGKDIEHLNKFNKFMKYNGNNVKLSNITLNEKTFTRCRWGVGNKHLWNTLNNYGCVPNKSLILKFPDKSIFKEEWLIIPFIRGYFDGDGCITNSCPNAKLGPRIQCSMLGTKEMLAPIRELFFDHDFQLNNKKNEITMVYSLSPKQTITFLEIIYYKATIFLDRKYNKFIEWKNCRPKVKALGLLESKFGEYWDANPELIYGFKRS